MATKKTYQTTLMIRGDSKDAVRQVQLTRQQLEELTGAQRKGQSAAARYREEFNAGAKVVAKWGAAAATAAGLAATAMVRSGLQSVDSLAKVSARLGIATEDLASLRFAAEQTGVSTSTLDMALQRMTRRVAEAAAGTGEARDALKELGLSATELNQLSPDQTFRRVTEAMEGVGNQSDRVRLAMKLFDSEGVSLVQTMGVGAETLDRFAQEARDAGIAINGIDAAKVEAANDAMNRVRTAFTGFSQQLAVRVAPLLETIADRMFGVAKEAGGIGKAADQSFSAVIDGIGVMLNGVQGLRVAWVGLKAVLQGWAVATLRVLDTVGRQITEWWNGLPFTDEREVRSSVEGALLSLESEFADTMRTLNRLVMEELPSDRLNGVVIGIERQWTASTDVMKDETRDFVAYSEDHFQRMDERLLKARESINKSSAELAKVAKEQAEQGSNDLQAAYDRGLERLDDTFANFFKDILRNGKVSFDGLKNLFIDTLGEMAVAAARSRIMVGIGVGGGSSAAMAGTGGAGGGILSTLGSGITGFGAGASNLVGQGLFAAGRATGSQTLVGLSGNAFNTANNLTLGGTLLGAGAGLAGGFAGNAVFGPTSGLGSGLGGTVGFALGGPLGAALGSFAGSGLESLLGGDNNGDNPGRARVNLGTGAINVGGVGNTFDQSNVDQVQSAADFAQRVAAVIGGSSAALDITAGRDGLRVGSRNFGQDSAAFLDRIFDNVVNQAGNLSQSLKRLITSFEGTAEQATAFADAVVSLDQLASRNPVTEVINQLEQGSLRAIDAYRQQISTIDTLRRNFDGSAVAAQELSAAVAQNQQAAAQLASALRGVADQSRQAFGSTAQSIRESVMSPQELRQARAAEFQELFRSISSIDDVGQLSSTSSRLNELINQRFGSIENPTEQQAEFFASQAEKVNERIEQRSQKLINDLQETQQKQNNELNQLLRQAAQSQQSAANTFLAAADSISAAASRFSQIAEVNA